MRAWPLVALLLLTVTASAQAPALTIGAITNTTAQTVTVEIMPFEIVNGTFLTGTLGSYVLGPGATLTGPFVLACNGLGGAAEAQVVTNDYVLGLAPCGESFTITVLQGDGNLVVY